MATACFTLPDPIVGDCIFAAIVPRSNQALSLRGIQVFLKHLEIAPYKYPGRLLVVKLIPRNADGAVLREQILREV